MQAVSELELELNELSYKTDLEPEVVLYLSTMQQVLQQYKQLNDTLRQNALLRGYGEFGYSGELNELTTRLAQQNVVNWPNLTQILQLQEKYHQSPSAATAADLQQHIAYCREKAASEETDSLYRAYEKNFAQVVALDSKERVTDKGGYSYKRTLAQEVLSSLALELNALAHNFQVKQLETFRIIIVSVVTLTVIIVLFLSIGIKYILA